MSFKTVVDNLGKVKAYQYKGDSVRLITPFIEALKAINQGVSMTSNLRSLLREASTIIFSNKAIAKYCPEQYAYVPGKEKELLKIAEVAYAKIVKEAEPKAEARLRKMRIDKAFNQGKRFLAQGQVSEADQQFQEAIKYYRDEHVLFILIAELLCDAQQYKRANTYVKKAALVFPADDLKLKKLQETIATHLSK